MKNKKQKLLAAGAAVLLAANAASGVQIVYQELFSNDFDSNQPVDRFGWHQYAYQISDGTCYGGITDCWVAAASAGGTGLGHYSVGSTNSFPLAPDGTGGFVYTQKGGRNQILFQDEYTFDVADIPNTLFYWNFKNQAIYESYRVLIGIADSDVDVTNINSGAVVDWYATDVLLHTMALDPDGNFLSTEELYLFDATWYNVNVVSNSIISRGTETTLPTSGYVVASGIYMDDKRSTQRIENFAIATDPNPPRVPHTIYHELFTAMGTTNNTLPELGWASYEGTNGAAWTYPHIAGTTAGGTTWGGGPRHSHPLNTTQGDGGFLYAYAHEDKASLFITDEYPFEMGAYTNLEFLLRHNSNRADILRAAIEVAGNWYVSDAVPIMAHAGWSESEIWKVEATNTTWHTLDFVPGSSMVVGAPAALPSTGSVGAFGFYVEAANADSIRFDNYRLVATALPEPPPPIGDIAVEYLGANNLALTWATGEGHNYTLWEKSDLVVDPTWSTNQAGIPGEAGSTTVTTAVDSVQAFYKVTAE